RAPPVRMISMVASEGRESGSSHVEPVYLDSHPDLSLDRFRVSLERDQAIAGSDPKLNDGNLVEPLSSRLIGGGEDAGEVRRSQRQLPQRAGSYRNRQPLQ